MHNSSLHKTVQHPMEGACRVQSHMRLSGLSTSNPNAVSLSSIHWKQATEHDLQASRLYGYDYEHGALHEGTRLNFTLPLGGICCSRLHLEGAAKALNEDWDQLHHERQRVIGRLPHQLIDGLEGRCL